MGTRGQNRYPGQEGPKLKKLPPPPYGGGGMLGRFAPAAHFISGLIKGSLASGEDISITLPI